MICEEPTYEGLIKLFLRGQRSLGLFSDEGGRFLGGHGMTADQSLKTITGLSELWDGKRVTRVRATDTTIILYGRRLAMHLMMQPVIAQRVLSDPLLHGQGFLNRCLLCWPTSTAGSRLYRDVDLTVDDDVQAYNARIAECLRAKPPRSPERLDELAPRALPLAPPAKKRWIQFHDYVERQLSEGQALRSIRGFGNKAAEHAARLAGVLTLVGDHTAATILLEELDAALLLVEFYLGEMRRLFCPDTTSPDVLLAEDLLAYLRDKDRISLPDIYQRGPEPLREAKTARRIVAILEEHGWLLRLPGSAEVGGVIRRETWEVRHVD